MIKFNGLNLKDLKITDALASVVNGKKIAVGSEIVWEKSVSPLPSGYTEVKYLQSSGKQYINTGKSIAYINSSNVTFVVNFAMTDITRTQIIFGVGTGGGLEKQLVFIPSTKKMRADYTNNYNTYYSTIIQEDVVYAFEQTETDGIFNDESKRIAYRVSLDILFTLFGKNKSAGIEQGTLSRCKMFDFILKEDGVLAMNFIPCLDPNNRPCFYDTVSQQPFYNQGTGEFGYETMDGTVVAPT